MAETLLTVKACTTCAEAKLLDEFHRDSRDRYGRRGSCKACVSAWRAANRARITAGENRYRAANAERHAAYRAAYRAANVERTAAYDAARYAENKEEMCARAAAYRAANPDRAAASTAAWRKANPERVAAQKARRLARERSAETTLTYEQWAKILDRYNGRCAICASPHPEVDHRVPIARGGAHTADNVWPLCKSHNSSKQDRDLFEWLERRWIEVRPEGRS